MAWHKSLKKENAPAKIGLQKSTLEQLANTIPVLEKKKLENAPIGLLLDWPVVFSTRGRAKLILPEFSSDLFAYMVGICSSLKSHAFKIGGTNNHVHIACSLPRTITVGNLLEEIKSKLNRQTHVDNQ